MMSTREQYQLYSIERVTFVENDTCSINYIIDIKPCLDNIDQLLMDIKIQDAVNNFLAQHQKNDQVLSEAQLLLLDDAIKLTIQTTITYIKLPVLYTDNAH